MIKDLERECHFEYLILGILIEVLDSINRKHGLDFDISYLEHEKTTYEFALEYLSEALDEIGFDPSIRQLSILIKKLSLSCIFSILFVAGCLLVHILSYNSTNLRNIRQSPKLSSPIPPYL